jgi:hypothetical protein
VKVQRQCHFLAWFLSSIALYSTMSALNLAYADDDKDPNSPIVGRFARVVEQKIELEDKRRFELLPGNDKALQESLRIVTRGQRIRLFRRDLKVREIMILDPTFEVDVTFENKLIQKPYMWLQLREGGQFEVAKDKILAMKEVFYFCDKGTRLRLTIFKRSVIGAKVYQSNFPPPRIPLTTKLRTAINSIQRLDLLIVNKKGRARVKKFNPQSITVQPLSKDGKNQGKPVWIPLGLIQDLENLSAADREQNAGKTGAGVKRGKDAFDIHKIGIGDTIQVGLRKGLLVRLGERRFDLRIWKNGQFAETVPFDRPKFADKVRRRELSSDRRVKINNGEVRVVCFRSRKASTGEFIFRARISHNLRGFLLIDAGLQGYLEGDRLLGAEGAYYKLDPIFAGEVFELSRKTENVDPSTDLLLIAKEKGNLIAISSKRARKFIGKRLNTKILGDQLLQAYEAVIENKSKDLVSVVLTHATRQDYPDAVKEQASETLQKCGNVAVDIVIEALQAKDRNLSFYDFDAQGQSIKVPMNEDVDLYRKKLFDLLGKLDQGVDQERAFRLFVLFKRYAKSPLGLQVIKVLQAHAEAAVNAVVEIASNISVGATPKEEAEIFLAAKLLHNLGKPAIKPLCKILMDLGQRAQVQIVRAKAKTIAPEILIRETLDYIIKAKRRGLRRKYNRVISSVATDIEKSSKIDDPIKAERLWYSFLMKLKNVPSQLRQLHKVLPRIYFELGSALVKQKRRGDAAYYLARCLALVEKIKSGRMIRKTRMLYGKLLLRSAYEEINQVALRKGPNDCYAMIKGCTRGVTFLVAKNKDPVGGWIPVRNDRKVAWIRRTTIASTDSSGSHVKVIVNSRPIEILRKIVGRARSYNGTLIALSNNIESELLAREISLLMRSNDYSGALKKMEGLKEINPSHAMLANLNQVWFLVNWYYPVLGLSIIFGFLVLFLRTILTRRQSQVVRSGEYVYYGRDRAKREREL